jgi:hypothetical protein
MNPQFGSNFFENFFVLAIEVCWVVDMSESVYDATNVSDCTVAHQAPGMEHETNFIRFACRIVCFFFLGWLLQPASLPDMNIRRHSNAQSSKNNGSPARASVRILTVATFTPQPAAAEFL